MGGLTTTLLNLDKSNSHQLLLILVSTFDRMISQGNSVILGVL